MQKISRKQILGLAFFFTALFLTLHAIATYHFIKDINLMKKELKGIEILRKLAKIQTEIQIQRETGSIDNKKLLEIFKELKKHPEYNRLNLGSILDPFFEKRARYINKNHENLTAINSHLSGELETILELMQKVFHSSHLVFEENQDTYFYLYYSVIRIPRLIESISKIRGLENFNNQINKNGFYTNKAEEASMFFKLNLEKFSYEIDFFDEIDSEDALKTKKDIILLYEKLQPLINQTVLDNRNKINKSFLSGILHRENELTMLQENLFQKSSILLDKKYIFHIAGSSIYFMSFTLLLIIFAKIIYNYNQSRNKYERLIDATSRSRKILIYEKNPSRIYSDFCQFISSAGYHLVWIGFALKDEEKSVLPIAYDGPAARYMEDLTVHWGDSLHGAGPVGNTIRTGKRTIVNDISNHYEYSPWKDKSAQFGIRSAAALPLNLKENTIGVIVLYSSRKFAFSHQELEIVQDLVNDLMFNISILRIRRDRDTARAKLQINNKQLEEKVAEKTRQIVNIQDATIFSLGALVEARDRETGNHIIRTREYINIMLKKMAGHSRYSNYLTPEISDYIFRSAPLHDIGKVGVPDNILGKPGKLSEEEHKIIQQHTIIGAQSIHSATLTLANPGFLKIAEEIVRHHHEKWDGSGYPDGLKGEEIPLAARVMTIADIYDALFFKRAYKSAMEHDEVVKVMKSLSGTTFDPELFDVFLEVSGSFHNIARKYSDENH